MFLSGWIYLANPLGLVALLGVPAAVLIFMLRLRAPKVPTSTLFLLEIVAHQDHRGTTFRAPKNALSLWLTLLSVLLAAWSLSDPRFIRRQSAQHVAIIIDTSYSMTPFLHDAKEEARKLIRSVASAATTTYWEVVPSDTWSPLLYRGTSLDAALGSLEKWNANRGAHDLKPRIDLLTSTLPADSLIVLITDRKQTSASRVQTIAVGRKLNNVGFVGLRTFKADDGYRYEALVMNHSDSDQTRTAHIETGPVTLQLASGELKQLTGRLPESPGEIRLRLDTDEFTLDDFLAVRIPIPRELSVGIDIKDSMYGQIRRLVSAFPAIKTGALRDNADILIAEELPPLVPGVLVPKSAPSRRLSSQQPLKEASQLTEGLRFDGLITSEHLTDVHPGAEPLLWRNSDVLISLLPGPVLQLHFDLRIGNAASHPGLLILISRFFEELRSQKLALDQRNFDMAQRIPLPRSVTSLQLHVEPLDGTPAKTIQLEGADTSSFAAPSIPALFTATSLDARSSGGLPIVRGTSNFAEVAEATFTNAEKYSSESELLAHQIERNSDPDPAQGLWITLLFVAICSTWWLEGRARNRLEASSHV